MPDLIELPETFAAADFVPRGDLSERNRSRQTVPEGSGDWILGLSRQEDGSGG